MDFKCYTSFMRKQKEQKKRRNKTKRMKKRVRKYYEESENGVYRLA